jgi:predicted dehydrogenase
MTVSQIATGRKNRLFVEIYGTKGSFAWDGERPDELWIGRRLFTQNVIAGFHCGLCHREVQNVGHADVHGIDGRERLPGPVANRARLHAAGGNRPADQRDRFRSRVLESVELQPPVP